MEIETCKYRGVRWIEPKDPAADDWSAVERFVTTTEIKTTFWPWWSEKWRKKFGTEPSLDDCVEDFAADYWGELVEKGSLL